MLKSIKAVKLTFHPIKGSPGVCSGRSTLRGEGGGWGNRGNFGTGVRASISKPTPFIYLAFEHPNC